MLERESKVCHQRVRRTVDKDEPTNANQSQWAISAASITPAPSLSPRTSLLANVSRLFDWEFGRGFDSGVFDWGFDSVCSSSFTTRGFKY